jgi:hypothetical protein
VRPGDAGGTERSPTPTKVIRLRKGGDERRQLAERIAAALRARRAAASASSSSVATRPELPAGSGSMDSPENVLAQMQNTLKQVKAYVSECVEQAGTKVSGFRADLSLTGDPDIGTLIDAKALTSTDGRPLPPQFDDCVRGVMQALELPPMGVGDEFKVNYEFQFD